jgi:hypothetical protein
VRRDAYGQDYRRDGDPTYVHPVPVRLLVVDTKSGAAHPVFADKRPVRLARWSPDGDRLAMLIFNGDVYEPAVWDRKADRVVNVHLPAGRYVAENSDLRWTADGKSLVFTVHRRSGEEGSRHVHQHDDRAGLLQSSLDPFLAGRRPSDGNVRSIVGFDLQTNVMRDLVPETMVGQYARKGRRALAYDVDIQKKTDYDNFNSEVARTRSTTGGAERVVFATTKECSSSGPTTDGTTFKDGRVCAGSIDERTRSNSRAGG